MRPQCIEEHLATLRRRYGGRLLREAAVRRAHLDYQAISFGGGRGSGRVRFLLAQMHQNYYFGWYESACILAGTLLEQGLIRRLERRQRERGPLAFRRDRRDRWLASRSDLLDLELVDMLDLARSEGLLHQGRLLLAAHQIRWIRNMVVHDRVPIFRERDERHFELIVAKSRKGPAKHATILLDKAEAAGLSGARAELTAYYCVSRARMILAALFHEEHTEEGGRDESGSGLLLWPER
jgi:hypothetical protein